MEVCRLMSDIAIDTRGTKIKSDRGKVMILNHSGTEQRQMKFKISISSFSEDLNLRVERLRCKNDVANSHYCGTSKII